LFVQKFRKVVGFLKELKNC